MIKRNDKVKYIGTATQQHTDKRGVVLCDPYEIREWTFVNVMFDKDETSRVVNVDNLKVTG